MISVDKNFNGACVGQVRIEDNNVYADLGREREEGNLMIDGRKMDYNCSFLFGVTNNGETDTNVNVYINCRMRPKAKAKPILYRRRREGLLTQFMPEGNYDEIKKQYFFELPLAAKETWQVSNVNWRSAEDLQLLFNELGRKGGARMINYGKSVLGYPLPLYIYDSENLGAPAILIVTGYHPMEPEWMATRSIMESLTGKDWQKYRKLLAFYIAPIANPDGFGLGYNACNAKLVNFYWDFKHNDKTNAPEAAALYDLAVKIKPAVYFDWHAYTYQQRKHPGPYIKPSILYSEKETRRAVRKMNNDLIKLCEGHYLYNYSTFTPSTLATILMNKFNTITFSKFHLHQLCPIEDNYRIAKKATELVLDTLMAEERLMAGKTSNRQRLWLYRILLAFESKTHALEIVDRFSKIRF